MIKVGDVIGWTVDDEEELKNFTLENSQEKS